MSSPAAEPDATDILTGRVAVNTTPSSTPSPAPSITASDVDDALVAAAGDADQEEAIVDRVVPAQKRISIYVQVFEEMIQTVMEHESFLFNEEEVALIRGFGQMSCELRWRKYSMYNNADWDINRRSTIPLRATLRSKEWMVPCLKAQIRR